MGWKTKKTNKKNRAERDYNKKIRELQKRIIELQENNSKLKHPEWPEDNQEFESYNNKKNKKNINRNNSYVYAELNNQQPINRRSLAKARLSHNNRVRSLSPEPIYETIENTRYGVPAPKKNSYNRPVSHYEKPILRNYYNIPNSHLTTNNNNLPPLPKRRRRNNKTTNNNLPPLPKPRKQ